MFYYKLSPGDYLRRIYPDVHYVVMSMCMCLQLRINVQQLNMYYHINLLTKCNIFSLFHIFFVFSRICSSPLFLYIDREQWVSFFRLVLCCPQVWFSFAYLASFNNNSSFKKKKRKSARLLRGCITSIQPSTVG